MKKNHQNSIINFAAGPAVLPPSILQEVQADLLDWNGLGISILEVGHRTAEFEGLMEDVEKELRALLQIPNEYAVIFLGSAARTQFAMLPLNVLPSDAKGGYLISGLWSMLAYQEACKLQRGYCVASAESYNFNALPERATWEVAANTGYLYYTPNETVQGVRFNTIPSTENIPLVADMTSCFLSEPLDIKKYGLVFAGCQKNLATSGLTIVIIAKSFLEAANISSLPTMWDYRTHIKHRSLYATPPIFSCYLVSKMFQWVKAQGGVEELYRQNCQKSSMLYSFIDNSNFYYCPISAEARSTTNVCFFLLNRNLEQKFLELAEERGFYGLKGHRSVGGIRASLYNAMPIAGVQKLIDFMQDFYKVYSNAI